MTPSGTEKATRTGWLNRNVVGMGLTSLLSDVSHEMATAVLPGFLTALGVSAAALGLIEGVADGVASFVKLASGWLSDRAGRRKPIAVGGYFITGSSSAIFALAAGWPLVLAGRVAGWFGRDPAWTSPGRMSVHQDEGGSSLPARAACHVRRWSNWNPDELLRDRPRECAQIESGVTDIRAIEQSAGEIGPDEAGVGEIGTVQIGSA